MSELDEIARAARNAKKPQVVEIKSAAESLTAVFVIRSFVAGFFGCLGVVVALYLVVQINDLVSRYKFSKWVEDNVPHITKP